MYTTVYDFMIICYNIFLYLNYFMIVGGPKGDLNQTDMSSLDTPSFPSTNYNTLGLRNNLRTQKHEADGILSLFKLSDS